ncbi:hypothetical protein JX266_009813 [Neoarthrinium moseri]|nr:hypothetical protein JX266_009813 [Neoarthrinium moseri]
MGDVTQTTVTVTQSIRDCREARADLISNCGDVTAKIEQVLVDVRRRRAGPIKWVLERKKEVGSLKNCLEAHRGALHLALEMVNLCANKIQLQCKVVVMLSSAALCQRRVHHSCPPIHTSLLQKKCSILLVGGATTRFILIEVRSLTARFPSTLSQTQELKTWVIAQSEFITDLLRVDTLEGIRISRFLADTAVDGPPMNKKNGREAIAIVDSRVNGPTKGKRDPTTSSQIMRKIPQANVSGKKSSKDADLDVIDLRVTDFLSNINIQVRRLTCFPRILDDIYTLGGSEDGKDVATLQTDRRTRVWNATFAGAKAYSFQQKRSGMTKPIGAQVVYHCNESEGWHQWHGAFILLHLKADARCQVYHGAQLLCNERRVFWPRLLSNLILIYFTSSTTYKRLRASQRSGAYVPLLIDQSFTLAHSDDESSIIGLKYEENNIYAAFLKRVAFYILRN